MLTHYVLGVPLIIAPLFIFPTLLILIGIAAWIDPRFAARCGLVGLGRDRQLFLAIENSSANDQRHGLIDIGPDNIPAGPMIDGPTHGSVEPGVEPTIDIGLLPEAAAPTDEMGHGDTVRLRDPPVDGECLPEGVTDRERRPVRWDEARPPPSTPDPDSTADAGQELAEMESFLRIAIRAQAKKDAALSAGLVQPTTTANLQPMCPPIVASPMPAGLARGISVLETLEMEMLSAAPTKRRTKSLE